MADNTTTEPENLEGNMTTKSLTNDDIQFLKQIWEHFDGIADGAPDASYAAKMALGFSQPLKRLIERVAQDTVQQELEQAHASGSDRVWDETVTRLRNEGLIR